MAQVHCMLGTYGCKHTPRICNTYCFSTATMASRMRLTVRLYVHCLSCFFSPFCLPPCDFIVCSIVYANIRVHGLGQEMGFELRVNFDVLLVLQYQSAGYCRPVLVNQSSFFPNGIVSNSHLIISAHIIHPNRKLFNSLSPELNPICYLLALLAHDFFHVSRIRVKSLTLRLLMSYIYMEHIFLMFLDHTQRRSTVGGTPLDE
jgi:hypothetical protein